MEKKFEVPENCKGFTIKSLEDGGFEVVYIIDKRVRVSDGDEYFFINTEGEIKSDSEDSMVTDRYRFNFGNYFINEELANEALIYIKNAFNEFWKTKSSSD